MGGFIPTDMLTEFQIIFSHEKFFFCREGAIRSPSKTPVFVDAKGFGPLQLFLNRFTLPTDKMFLVPDSIALKLSCD